jgi:hypothetical protein
LIKTNRSLIKIHGWLEQEAVYMHSERVFEKKRERKNVTSKGFRY